MRDDDDWQDWTATRRALATYWRAEQVSDLPVSHYVKKSHHLDTRLMEMGTIVWLTYECRSVRALKLSIKAGKEAYGRDSVKLAEVRERP